MLEPVLCCKAVWNTKGEERWFLKGNLEYWYLVKGVWMLSGHELYLESPVSTTKASRFSGQTLSSRWKQETEGPQFVLSQQ